MAADARAKCRGAERYGRPVPLFRLHGSGGVPVLCVRRTVEQDLPREIDYLRRHDEAIRRIMDTVEMPDRMAENLVMFIRLERGQAGPQADARSEFEKLTDDEVASIEAIVPSLRRFRSLRQSAT